MRDRGTWQRMGSWDRLFSFLYTSCPLSKTKRHTLPAVSAGLAAKQRSFPFLFCFKSPFIHRPRPLNLLG